MNSTAKNTSKTSDNYSNLLSNLLRLITPDEIQQLTTISQGEERHSLTEMLRKELSLKLENSNVVPLQVVKTNVEADIKEKKNFLTESKGVAFILEIKEKMKSSQDSLKSKEIFALYKKSSLVDIDQEKNHKDDLKKSSFSGVLINKKQA